ncbi:PREDICTED: uncharacterized protein LOC107091954 [Cyprinodon variegatus]|uniref:uncharacterized protein LOC107091954 n=1 Tax=Cyprinodon variegatus TaxID=28743 RepID=UPI0007429E78|nr:PREDICTED: uncharacterized protein LOC107091954 [Cyprinodon variegatus]
MKRFCIPLRGDHSLLTPDTKSSSGVSLREPGTLEGRASLPGHLSDLSARWRPSASPTRRLRFEDETEIEAESRYRERQLQRTFGQPGTGVLMSKLDINQCINARLGHKGTEADAGQQQRRKTMMRVVRPFESGGVKLGNTAHLDQRLLQHPPLNERRGSGLARPHLHMRTELLKDSYIGCVTPAPSGDGVGGDVSKHGRGRANMMQKNSNQVIDSQAPLTLEIPVNPYAPVTVGTPPQSSTAPHHPRSCLSTLTPLTVRPLMMSGNGNLNNTATGENRNQNEEKQRNHSAAEPHREPQTRSELKERRRCSSSAEDRAPPTRTERHVSHPIREELQGTITPPERFSRDGPSRLSLRRLFSTVKLSRPRTGSLDRLSTKPHPPTLDHAPNDGSRSCSLLKKSPSAQSLGALGLKKYSSIQSFSSEKNKNRCAEHRPADEQFLPRCLSSEDISQPCSGRSVGRVLQVCSDGTVLLELSRPADQKLGFIIGRGKQRTDSGVYVEDLVDRCSQKLYAGLLSVGDEILEVNREKVASLSLDQVNQVLLQNPTSTVRILRRKTASAL